jgi:hypothetical protein
MREACFPTGSGGDWLGVLSSSVRLKDWCMGSAELASRGVVSSVLLVYEGMTASSGIERGEEVFSFRAINTLSTA